MKEIKNLILVVVGSFIVSFAAVGFLSPNDVITGGGVGIAQLFHEVFPSITLGTWIAIIAFPLLVLGWIYFGRAYILKSLFSIVLISIFADILKEVFKIPALTNNILLACIFGGILVGLGVGIVIVGRSSTGGTTVLGEIIASKSRFKTAEVLLIIDGLTMLSSIFVYGNIDNSLYSIIGVFITTRIIDMILSGKPAQKAVHIVSYNPKVLSEQIYERLGKHGSVLTGTNLKNTHSKTLIFIAVEVTKLQLLKDIISEYDKEAFIIVNEASEFHGWD